MDDDVWGTGRDQFRTYRLRNSWSLRRAGLKGRAIEAKITADDPPMLVLTGSRRGHLTFPLTDIERMRAGIQVGKYRRLDYYRCLIWRAGERKLLLSCTLAKR